MAHLYSHLRVHQIFGANTDVGKTIFTTGLCIASEKLALSSTASVSSTSSHLPTKTLDLGGAKQESGAAPINGERTHYCKPVQTGPQHDWDALHLQSFSPNTAVSTLYTFPQPLSPHVAALPHLSGGAKCPSDEELVQAAKSWLHATSSSCTSGPPAAAYLEAAGGVHSPSPAGRSLSTVLRPLRLPTILIGSAELGGISTTRSAYESLLLAGYSVEAILLFPSEGRLGNVEYLRKLFEDPSGQYGSQGQGTRVFGIGGPVQSDGAEVNAYWGPPRFSNHHPKGSEADRKQMAAYYRGLVHGRTQAPSSASNEYDGSGLLGVVSYLRQRHAERIRELQSMAARTRESVWWPFTQHRLTKTDEQVLVIDSAHGDHFDALNHAASSSSSPSSSSSASEHQATTSQSLLTPTFDGSASWWTQCVGHANPRLTLAAARAAGRYGHVIFPNATHEPALKLSERLIGKSRAVESRGTSEETRTEEVAPGKGWADRVYFSDDGSTGMEIALKMAIASSRLRYGVHNEETDQLKQRVAPGRQAGGLGGRASREWEVLGLKGSYHGDTIGAMDACEPSVYSKAVDWYRGRGHWFDPPSVRFKDGKARVAIPASMSAGEKTKEEEYGSLQEIYNVNERVGSDRLAALYKDHIKRQLDLLIRIEGRRFGAVVLEPLVLGAGGMVFVDPLFQRCLVDVVRDSEDLFSLSDPPLRGARMNSGGTLADGESDWKGLPIIFDEVFTGLFRLGFMTPAEALGVKPDISCLAKILTGGMMPMSVTLASEAIFNTFARSDRKVDALLHGHSYTAYPIGCEVANETLDMLEEMQTQGQWTAAKQSWSSAMVTAPHTDTTTPIWSLWSPSFVEEVSRHPQIENIVALGCVLAVEIKDQTGAGGYQSTASVDLLNKLRSISENQTDGSSFSIHARPLGNVVYLMSSLTTPQATLREVEQTFRQALKGERE